MPDFLTLYPTYISIHAPRMGGDEAQRQIEKVKRISIHAPRMGGDGTA